MRRDAERTDGPVASGGSEPVRSRWKPSPLACWFLAILVFDVSMLLLASGVRSTGNDAAGNGMVEAFREAFVEAGAILLAILSLLFVVIRHRGVRIGLMVALVLSSLLLPVLLH